MSFTTTDASRPSTSGREAVRRLSARERDILRLMAEGRSNAGISGDLYLSVKTVECHIGSLFTKLDLIAETSRNRRVLAVLAWLRCPGDDTA